MSPRGLTQVEAARRAALLSVRHYDIAVDLTALPGDGPLRCVSTMTFRCAEPGAASFVDCAAVVVAATLNGEPLPPAAHGRIPLPRLAADNELRVETVQSRTTDGAGVHRAVDPVDGEVYVWTSFEPDAAHQVWACFDQPDLKATHAFTVTAPVAWTVTSNSGGPRVEPLGDARRWTFPATPRLSPYNTVVNAGPLHQIRRAAGGYDLGIFARRSLAGVLERDADEIFTVTAQGLAHFGAAFGMPFPQASYDQVFMPEFGGAMENYGCVTWSDAWLRRSPPTPAERERLATVLLHEMAHMWFGNIVTMRWWDDLWLNEAFAEFACYWAATAATRYTEAWAGLLAGDKLRAYLADQSPVSHPIRQPVPDVAEAAAIFDAITYPKGAAVLRQLVTYVGEENFVAGMRRYFARHAWGNTTLQDLIDALAETSGRDLDGWRAGWLDTAGTDRLTLESGDQGLVLAGRGPHGPPRPQVLAVGAYARTAGGLTRTGLAEVDVRGPYTPVDLPAGADLYLVNDEDLTFAVTRPAGGVEELVASAAALPTAVSRGVVVATVWDMLTTGEATADDAVRCLTSVLAVETSDAVIEPYLRLAGNAAELWAGDDRRDRLLAAVAATCARLAEDPGRRVVALRALARAAGDLAAVDRLRDVAGDDVDLHWRALQRRAELGGDTATEVRDLLARDPDPDARFRALAVRAAAPDPEDKAAVWRTLAVDRAVPVGSLTAVTTAFWRPGQDALLAGHAEAYLRLLPELGRAGMIPAMAYSQRLFPVFAGGADFPARAETAAAGAAPVVRRSVRERADELRRMLRSRQSTRCADTAA
ncbi:aminopeptidase N [Micromonospora sp. PLK6-60]|uniref:aminopeptidase N n=1 Tax=Micromonospora sp. PLK6-60 TaxID=2873383 RepID=UPI001CA74D09|nr:aminopeptidase N [Micromonospora sp. PLK6-60]MBY8870748.1 aminopeptidase N [Micromonospora sp. PLK6-60]